MFIQPISNFTAKKINSYNLVRYTGYGTLALGTLSVIQGVRHKTKTHKLFAIAAIALAIAHTAVIEYLNHKK